MAARIRKVKHDEDTRLKIKSSQLINFVQNHVLNGAAATKTQISGALGLLKKTLPDLQSVDGSLNLHHFKHEEAIKDLE